MREAFDASDGPHRHRSPNTLTSEQERHLDQPTRGWAEIDKLVRSGSSGTVELMTTMNSYDGVLVHLERKKGHE
jgi:hypothetical protein